MRPAILIAIQPRFVADILNGKKLVDIRKTCPREWKWFWQRESSNVLPDSIDVYIYCTKGNKHECLEYADNPNPKKEGKWFITGGYPYANGKVVAKFTLNKIEPIKYHFGYYDMGEWSESYILEKACLNAMELDDYLQASKNYDEKKISEICGYAWHIDDLIVFDKPMKLSQFKYPKPAICGKKDKNGLYQCHKCIYGIKELCECRRDKVKVPQSWCYIEV